MKPDDKLVELKVHAKDWKLPYDEIITDINFEFKKRPDVACEIAKEIAEQDFFFFCYAILDVYYLNHPFAIQRCYEYEKNLFENGIHLWSRDHFKSTILNKCGTIYKETKKHGRRQAIFSLNSTLAKKHLANIKYECETNELLKRLWSNIFWDDPRKMVRTDGVKWSEDGINFKTATSAKDLSVSAFGLIDSMPTGSHFTDKIYDDIVDLNNISTFNMKEKVLYAINMSDNLGDSHSGTVDTFIGTRYDYDDPYGSIIETYGYKVFTYPAEVDNYNKFVIGGRPVLLDRETLDKKLKRQGIAIYSAQCGQTPLNFRNRGFDKDFFRVVDEIPEGLNYIIVCDGAKRPKTADQGKKKYKQDFTVFKVIGLGAGQKNYIADIVRDRLTLPEKWENLKRMYKEFKPYAIYYEQVGAMSDVEYFELKMSEENFYFTITEFSNNQSNKDKRIEDLSSLYEERKIIYKNEIWYRTRDRGVVNLTKEFYEEEYCRYPKVDHDDGLDTDSWLLLDKIIKNYPSSNDAVDVSEKIQKESKHYISPLDENENENGDCAWYAI